MNLRNFYIEYKSELVFGLILSVVAVASYYLSRFIPEDIFEYFVNPIEEICTIVVCLYGAWVMSRHLEGNRLRQTWMVSLIIWAVLITGMLIMHYGAGIKSVGGTPDDPLYNMSLILGNILAWLLFAYPTQVLQPEWLTWKKVAIGVLPVLLVGVIDYFVPFDLIYLIMLYPVVLFWLTCRHIRKYRQWCEDNYSSLDNFDVQWVVRYLVILFLLGVSFYFIVFWYIPNRLFTQQWLLLLLLGYATEQILYRKDPWEDMERNETLSEESKHSIETESAQEAEESDEQLEEHKRLVEQWMESEKPYLNPDFQLMDLRAVLPMNRTYLSRFVRDAFDCSFYHLVNRYRIKEAKRLMSEQPELKVQEVAARCGFSSPTVFGRTFARETGMTPTEWSAQYL